MNTDWVHSTVTTDDVTALAAHPFGISSEARDMLGDLVKSEVILCGAWRRDQTPSAVHYALDQVTRDSIQTGAQEQLTCGRASVMISVKDGKVEVKIYLTEAVEAAPAVTRGRTNELQITPLHLYRIWPNILADISWIAGEASEPVTSALISIRIHRAPRDGEPDEITSLPFPVDSAGSRGVRLRISGVPVTVLPIFGRWYMGSIVAIKMDQKAPHYLCSNTVRGAQVMPASEGGPLATMEDAQSILFTGDCVQCRAKAEQVNRFVPNT